jgi:hypothetical protein
VLTRCLRSGFQLGELRLAPPYLPLWSFFCHAICFFGKLLGPSWGQRSWLSLNRARFEVKNASKFVHATVPAGWLGRGHRERACTAGIGLSRGGRLPLANSRAWVAPRRASAWRWSTPAGCGSAPAVPCTPRSGLDSVSQALWTRYQSSGPCHSVQDVHANLSAWPSARTWTRFPWSLPASTAPEDPDRHWSWHRQARPPPLSVPSNSRCPGQIARPSWEGASYI